MTVQAPGGAPALAAHDRRVRRRLAILLLLAAIALCGFVLDVSTGPANLAPGQVLRALLDPGGVGRGLASIVWDVRLPIALLALGVGAALSLAGAEMQTVLDNPLASPFTLGMSSAATFGAALAIVLDLSVPGVPQGWLISVNAFLFALLSAMLLQMLARLRGIAGPETIVLFGIALLFSFNALVALIQFVASEQALQQLVFWTLGSLSRASFDKAGAVALVIAVTLPLSVASSWQLTALRLGEERAASFGVPVGRLRFFALARISLLTGTAVAFVGVIGFVGLIGPHIARLLVGEDHRFFLPGSVLAGAALMAFASVASKIIVPGVLIPVGIVTALVGIPAFLAIVLTSGRRG
ncbi:FecCD family ABC transporter permease [Enterovirga rhinocerotis]|uniref:Iron complex transport system permease protein n=1 Tax=Enterovirga rhinocerotis TaxID=1339210 RepID=A0A4R7BNF7_9HYPH|nr:iron ABC transporter permease [Enterovirga rhinocerotis]TDR87070.1 iron complex transport system permease protein [Enterovirga rhinocerotis]